MKQLFLMLCICLFGPVCGQAQERMPHNYSVMLGGGVALPHVEGNREDFFARNGNRTGYDLMAEGRYYFSDYVAVGLQYDYLNMKDMPDKAHVHFVHPNFTLRYLFDNANAGLFCSLGVGYMDYQERVYNRGERFGHRYHKPYCGIAFAVGYEFHISSGVCGVLRADVLTADWFANPDARLFNTDGYDDGINHSLFKNNITFFNFCFALQIGR